MDITQDFPNEFAGLTDPYQILELWWNEAHTTNLKDANAIHLATVDQQNRPHGRVVLAKEIRPEQGIVFYTNYQSGKGQEIEGNPNVAVTFFWDPIGKQVRCLGKTKKLSRKESEAYWDSRPRSRQLSQIASRQSQPVLTRQIMEASLKEAEELYLDKAVPCPPHWGGYIVELESIEFWAGHPDRFHDRYRFTKVGKVWTTQRLYP